MTCFFPASSSSCAGEHLPLIKNGNLNSSIFLAGWKSKGKITKTTDLTNGEGKSALIGADGILSQDFIQTPFAGLTNFKISFLIRVDVFDRNARIRLRSNENDGDIITIRPTAQGIEAYGFNTTNGWKLILTKPLIAGNTYRVAISAKDLNQPSRSYTVSLTDEESATDEFAALADIRDTHSMTDGIIRTMNSADLPLEFAAMHTNTSGTASQSGYFRIGGPMTLNSVTDATAESSLRTSTATNKDFGSDAASAWVMQGSARLRLPKLDPSYDAQFASGWARGFRETVTERQMLNCHGTFYEEPRDISGDKRRMKPIATHGKRITDFASWRGLFVATGVLDSAPTSDKVVRASNGNGALWLGEVDDLWRMGEPRGFGGPWLNTSVTANAASDAYLMYGYDHKELNLSHTSAGSVNFTVEVDFLGDNTWVPYNTFPVAPGESFTHAFPAGYSAHWVRLKSNVATTASAQFVYGPADTRDAFLDWARDQGLATGLDRNTLQTTDTDHDGIVDLFEYVFALSPNEVNPGIGVQIMQEGNQAIASIDLRTDHQDVALVWETSDDLEHWDTTPAQELPNVDQTGVAAGSIRRAFSLPSGHTHKFGRLRYGKLP